MPRTLPPYRPGLGGNPVGAAVGVQGFVSATNHLRTAVNDIMPGDAVNGFFSVIAVHVLSVPVAAGAVMQSGTAALRGWRSYITAGFQLSGLLQNGAGASIVSPVSALLAGDIGKVVLFAVVWDSVAAKIRAYRVGVEVGAGAGMVGYSVASAADRSSLGGDIAALQSAPWARIVGALYGTGIPQPADIAAHYNACKAANDMVEMGGVGVTNVNHWCARDNIPNAATWVDRKSGMGMNKTGTLSSVIFNPVFE